MEDKAKGKMKEAAGVMTGDQDKKVEVRAQQSKGAAREEAAQGAKTRQAEKEAKEVERERNSKRREEKGGLLGDVGGTLTGSRPPLFIITGSGPQLLGASAHFTPWCP